MQYHIHYARARQPLHLGLNILINPHAVHDFLLSVACAHNSALGQALYTTVNCLINDT